MNTLTKFSAIFLLLLTSSCFMDGIKGDRNVVTERRNITSNFEAIDVNQGIEVHLTIGDDVELTVEADENLQEIITAEVKDGTLYIYAEKNIWSSKSRKVYVTAMGVNEISTSSGAEVISENTISSNDLKLNATSGSNVRLQLMVANLNCSTTSGADAILKGRASNFKASSTSGGNINAKGLKTKSCKAKATSGAGIYVNVSENLDAIATSGGDIKFIGHPKTVQKVVSSSGGIQNKQNN